MELLVGLVLGAILASMGWGDICRAPAGALQISCREKKILKKVLVKNLKDQVEDYILMKIQKTQSGSSMLLQQTPEQLWQELKKLINLLLEKFKYLPSWNNEPRYLVKKNKQVLLKKVKKL